MNKIHYLESTKARRLRLNSEGCHGQAICSTGNAHASLTEDKKAVTCEKCLLLLNKGA